MKLDTGGTLVLRSPVEQDVQTLLDYLAVIFDEHDHLLFEPGEFKPTLEQEKEWVRNQAASKTGFALCAFSGNEAVGVLNLDENKARRVAHTADMGGPCARHTLAGALARAC